ncbi:MAG: ABC transporter permease subunit, partial [Treponema sp.]|nr:ABC transporter permease subunit [Treponema sp.]
NKRMLTALIVVPLVMTVVLPLIFILIILLSPVDSPDLMELMQMLESSYPENHILNSDNIQYMLVDMIMNNVIPIFFILIPVVMASSMASSSFVGEKEKSTLETLLYCPLPLRKIFNAKILASFLLSMAISVFSFIVMMVVTEILFFVLTESIIMPNINWAIIILLVSPAAAIISINLIVRNSAKAQSSEEAQQSSLFLVLPAILLFVGQFTGLMMMSVKLFLLIAAVLVVIAALTFKSSFAKFNYEALLR